VYGTDTGAPTTIPVLSDSEDAEQLDAAALTGADATVSGDHPPTELTGPRLGSYKISSKPILVTRELMTDGVIDMVGEVIFALLARVMRFENKRYTTGTGANQAEGVLQNCSLFHADGPISLDIALNLAYSVPQLYRTGPKVAFMASDQTIKFLREEATGISGDRRKLWQEASAAGGGTAQGTPASLWGWPILVNNDLPSVDGSGHFIGGELVFGDWNKFVVREAEQGIPYIYSYLVPAKDGRASIVFRRSDSKLLVPKAIGKLMPLSS
jgi:HK97 family phage major capsid protein